MTNRPPPSLAKWPFIVTDIVLLVGFAWMIRYVLPPRSTGDYAAMFTLIILWMSVSFVAILPWLKEYQAQAKYAELDALGSAVEQIQKLEEVSAQIKAATGSWQSAQDAAARVTATAREIQDRIKADAKDFMEFAERINNDEKQNLRLEVEKLRRAEAEWLQVAARMLDHTFAITSAAVKSGQPNLASQMTNFQSACREAARRVGLVPFHPGAGEPYDERSQQLEDPNAKPEEGSVVTEVLATGYTFQGQLLRKSLVRVAKPDAAPEQTEPTAESVTVETAAIESIEPGPESQHEQSSPSDEAQATAVVTEQIAEPVNTGPTEGISVATEAEEMHEERAEPPQNETPAGTEDFVVETYRPAEPNPQPEAEALNQEVTPIESAAAGAENAHNEIAEVAEVAEVASREPVTESTSEEKPRRRQRKPDPQASLPF